MITIKNLSYFDRIKNLGLVVGYSKEISKGGGGSVVISDDEKIMIL